MKILCIGDVCGSVGCNYLMRALPEIKRENGVDLCIVNGENSADRNGITPESADMIYAAGADVITGGNHSFRRKEIFGRFESDPFLICPENAVTDAPKKGLAIVDLGRVSAAVINLCGRVYMPEADDPFSAADKLIKAAASKGVGITVLDFHAEATSEKKALAYYLDGRVSAVFGTHTHVATADEQILEGGTGFITDVGMTGPRDSVLGVKKELSIAKIKDGAPVRFELDGGKCRLDGCIFEVDERTAKTVSVKRIALYE